MVRVRFAPSPTGALHIGGARTALFNWMYARSQKGQFVLRIEDTDRVRSRKEFLEEILESMSWLGLNWDEVYHQGERFSLYREYAEKILVKDKAYKEGEAIIAKMPQKQIKVYDLIHGEIEFDTATIKDQVLIKSDGSPTYSFACVVDDALMEISHVIRGDDHIPNTPKQVILYELLGFKPPKFAHLPLIMGSDGARLSKRTGAVAVSDYRRKGFLPEALVNYLMLLGWSPGSNQEIIEMSSALKKFSIKKINKTAADFSIDKLKWINAQYIKKAQPSRIVDLLIPFLKERGYILEDFDRKHLESVVKLFQSRMPTLVDFLDRADYIFLDSPVIDPEAKEKYLSTDKTKEFRLLAEELNSLEVFNAQSTEEVFRKIVEKLGIGAAELVHPVRVALTGKSVGIGLFDTMVILGKEKTVRRLLRATKNNPIS